MIFFPRHAATFLHGYVDGQLCQANETCTNLAAWAFSIAGRGAEPTACCFPCVDDLAERARQLDLPVVLERVQPDTCYACACRVAGGRRYVLRPAPVDGEAPLAVKQLGPFCGNACALVWLALVRRREVLS